MYRKVARIFGIVFVIMGVLGFVPGITYHAKFLGIFHVNAALNLVYLITGVISWWVSRTSLRSSQIFFQIAGIVYAVIALLGFGYGTRDVFGLLANNLAGAWLHLVTGIFALYIGFIYKAK